MDASITATALTQSIASDAAPLLIDVRRRPAFLESRLTIAGALRRDPDRVEQWLKTLPGAARVVQTRKERSAYMEHAGVAM